MEHQFTRIAVKIGEQCAYTKGWHTGRHTHVGLTDQIAGLHKAGIEVILISSGAVASGRSEVKTNKARQCGPTTAFLGCGTKPN